MYKVIIDEVYEAWVGTYAQCVELISGVLERRPDADCALISLETGRAVSYVLD